jgi:hypothetical protein
MTLSSTTKILAGITFITLPSIEFGGTFLLGILAGEHPELGLTELQRSLFRAGHAHAGVLVLLGLIGQIYADHLRLPRTVVGLVRGGLIVAPLFISGGFFAAGSVGDRVGPGIGLVWLGAAVLAVTVVLLGVGLIRGRGTAAAATG